MMQILAGVLILGALVLAHELGHFVLARLTGVKVTKFSLGFGRKVFSWQKGDTEYQLSLIPLGGYVQMLHVPSAETSEIGRSFPEKTLWQRAAIVVAGPAVNLALPFLILPLAYLAGMQVPAYLDAPARVGYVGVGSPAASAGFLPGDTIISVADQKVESWAQGEALILQGAAQSFMVMRDGSPLEMSLPPGSSLQDLGVFPEADPMVASVTPGMPGEGAGLQVGDLVQAINSVPIASWHALVGALQTSQGTPLLLTVQNPAGERRTLTLTPVLQGGRYLAGIGQKQRTVEKNYDLAAAVQAGAGRAKEMLSSTFVFLGKMITGSAPSQSVGGPIAIVQLAGQSAASGLSVILTVVAFLSIQLGILNLFPIPVFDGGQMLLLAYEGLVGSPPPDKALIVFQKFGMGLVLLLMCFAFYNDLSRIF